MYYHKLKYIKLYYRNYYMNNPVILDLQFACSDLFEMPNPNQIKSWVQKIFSEHIKQIELTIRIVDIPEMVYLNWYYLGKNYPTNVLSFPFETTLKIQPLLLGDIIICKKIVRNEAYQKNISLNTYWAYIITHGSLHLLGYNHIINKEAILMSQAESNIMKKIGFF